MDWTSLPKLNFPFMSVLIALLGSEVVEKHLQSSDVYDEWRRISTLWSSFGLFGAISFCARLALGTYVDGGEGVPVTRAGSAGVHNDHERENSPASSWSSKQAEELLFLMTTSYKTSALSSTSSESTWLAPIFIAIGYSGSPWSCSGLLWRRVVSLFVVTTPTMMLFPSLYNLSPLESATVYLQVTAGIFGATFLPKSVDRSNAPILEPLSQIYQDRLVSLGKKFSLLQDGDLVISDPRRNAHVVWKTASTTDNLYALRNDDIIPRRIRAQAGLGLLLILGAFLGTYIALGHATKERQYLWLGAQVSFFALRFAMWSRKQLASSLSSRRFLYLVAGSLVNQNNGIPLTPPSQRIPASQKEKLDINVVRFALAASNSMVRDKGRRGTLRSNHVLHRGRLHDMFSRMANNVPSDILCVEYVDLEPYLNDNKKTDISVLRLSWGFVQEVYRAQGVILGHEPRTVGGIYLGAVFVQNTFVGLTTVHPFALHAQYCADKSSSSWVPVGPVEQHEELSLRLRQGGFTRDGYFVANLIFGAVVGITADTDSDLLVQSAVGNTDIREWHDLFRANVARCRSTAKPNGPSFVEIHTSTALGLDQGLPRRGEDVMRIEPLTDDVGDLIPTSAYFAMANERGDKFGEAPREGRTRSE